MHVCKRFLRRFVAQLTGYALRAWARATRRAERCTIATFSSLARCVHDPLRALRRLNQLGAWRALQTWVAFTTSTVFLEGQRRASAATVIRLLADGGWRLKRAALLAWVDRCTRVRAAERACRLVKRVVGRLEHGAEATAIHVWIRFCRDAALRDHDVAVAALRQKEAALRATTLMRSSSARALAAAWITWSTAVHRADVKESTIRRMIKRLVSRLTIRALCTWRIATALSERAVQTLAARFVRRRLLLRVLRMRRSICEMIQLAAGFWKWVVYRQLSLHMRLAHVRSVTKVKRNLRRSCMRTLECISALRAAVAASGALYYAECLGRLG